MAATGQKERFIEIWAERPHFSEVLGPDGERIPLTLPVGHKFWYNYFSHCLPKSIYRKAMLSRENIILMTPEQHRLYGNHVHKVKHLPEWQWVFEKYEHLKQLYHQGHFN